MRFTGKNKCVQVGHRRGRRPSLLEEQGMQPIDHAPVYGLDREFQAVQELVRKLDLLIDGQRAILKKLDQLQ